jgi:DNA polymerase/3'-5' exonuclease PolX
MDIKTILINNFEILFKDEESGFKKKFYANTIKHLKDMDIQEIQDRNTFIDLKDIGKKINEKILFIISTGGNLERVDKIINENKDTFDITTVYGIGPSQKNKIEKTYGKIKTLEHLVELDIEYNFLNAKQKIGIKYCDQISQRIPRNEMYVHDNFIKDSINSKSDVKYQITGSFRRHEDTSGDIDILLTTNHKHVSKKLKDFVTILKEKGYIIEDLAFGDKKFMGMCKLPNHDTARRLDILIVKPQEYFFGLLYFTGSSDLNKEMRIAALEQGFSLNEKELTSVETKTKVLGNFTSEADIFHFLGFEYIAPSDRVSGSLRKL